MIQQIDQIKQRMDDLNLQKKYQAATKELKDEKYKNTQNCELMKVEYDGIIDRLKNENENTKQRLLGLQKEKNELQTSLDARATELAAKDDEIRNLREQIANVKRKYTALKEKCILQNLDAAKAKCNAINEQQRIRESAKAAYGKLQNERNYLQASIDELENKYQAETKELKNANENSKQRLLELQAKYKRMEQDCNEKMVQSFHSFDASSASKTSSESSELISESDSIDSFLIMNEIEEEYNEIYGEYSVRQIEQCESNQSIQKMLSEFQSFLSAKMLMMNEQSVKSLMDTIRSALMQIDLQKDKTQNDDDVETVSTQSYEDRNIFILQEIDDEYLRTSHRGKYNQNEQKTDSYSSILTQRQLVKHEDGDVCKMSEKILKLEQDLKTANIRNCVLYKQYQDANEQNLKWKEMMTNNPFDNCKFENCSFTFHH